MKLIQNSFDIANEILKLSVEAKDFLYLISPFIQFEKADTEGFSLIKQAIFNILSRDVEVIILVRPIKNPLKMNQFKGLIERGCIIKFLPNLNSKIYINESAVIITSMNLYYTSVLRNEEIGLKLYRNVEGEIYNRILKYVKGLITRSYDVIDHTREKTQIDRKLSDKQYVYVLKLENNRWWIGKNKNPSSRINKHINKMGSMWTRDNKVIGEEELLEDADLTEITLKYMKEYGWENVRGTCFNNMPEKYIPKKIKDYIYNQGRDFDMIFQQDNEVTDGEDLIDFEEYNYEPKSQEKDKKSLVYVVRLENGKWWVGKTKNIEKRINKIKKGRGPPWTVINPLIELEELRENVNLKEVTLEYMRKYGWENVRGYAWSQWNMERPPKELRGILEPWEARKHSRNGDYLIYVLKLQNGKWFIGKTTNIQHELRDHNLGLISPFTSVNKVLKLEELIENGNFDQVVSSYTKKYGEENIRVEV